MLQRKQWNGRYSAHILYIYAADDTFISSQYSLQKFFLWRLLNETRKLFITSSYSVSNSAAVVCVGMSKLLHRKFQNTWCGLWWGTSIVCWGTPGMQENVATGHFLSRVKSLGRSENTVESYGCRSTNFRPKLGFFPKKIKNVKITPS